MQDAAMQKDTQVWIQVALMSALCTLLHCRDDGTPIYHPILVRRCHPKHVRECLGIQSITSFCHQTL